MRERERGALKEEKFVCVCVCTPTTLVVSVCDAFQSIIKTLLAMMMLIDEGNNPFD